MNKTLTNIRIQEILKKIPHRHPFILIDRVLSLELGNNITAIKNVTSNECCFQGHFPELPVMPGVLILESLAQACALLFIYSTEHNALGGYVPPEKGTFLFAGMDNVRFKKVVEPGDQLILECNIVKYKKDLAKFSTQAIVGDNVVCSAEMLSAYRNIEVGSHE